MFKEIEWGDLALKFFGRFWPTRYFAPERRWFKGFSERWPSTTGFRLSSFLCCDEVVGGNRGRFEFPCLYAIFFETGGWESIAPGVLFSISGSKGRKVKVLEWIHVFVTVLSGPVDGFMG